MQDTSASINTQSRDWQIIKKRIEHRLAASRQEHESPHCTDARSAYLRGEINGLKWLLDLPKKPTEAMIFSTEHRPGE